MANVFGVLKTSSPDSHITARKWLTSPAHVPILPDGNRHLLRVRLLLDALGQRHVAGFEKNLLRLFDAATRRTILLTHIIGLGGDAARFEIRVPPPRLQRGPETRVRQ